MANVLDTTAVALRKGTKEENESFVGIQAEVSVDLGNPDESGVVGVDGNVTLRVHNGYTPGGIPLARADMKNMTTAALAENRPLIGDRNLAYATLENIEPTTVTSAKQKIVNTLSSYGLAKKTDLDDLAKKDMSNVDTADLAESNGHAGKNLAYADFANVDTSNLTLNEENRPVTMEGPVIASADFGNITDETWTQVTNEKILPIVQQGVEFTRNKDEEIDEYVVEEGHYPSTQAVVDFVNQKASDQVYLKRDFSNVSDWSALYYGEGEVTYAYEAHISMSSAGFIENKLYLTDCILNNDIREPLVVRVNSTDSTGYIDVDDVELIQYVGEVDLTGKTIKITSNTSVDAYLVINSEPDEDEEGIYRYSVNSVSCPQDAGFAIGDYINTGDDVYFAQRLWIKPTEVDASGIILEAKTHPETGNVKIYTEDESGDEDAKVVYVYGMNDATGAAVVVVSKPLTPEIGGAGVVKTNLTNLPGMTEEDALMEEESPWWIRHDLALPSGSGELTDKDTYRLATVKEVVQAIENGGGSGGGAGLARRAIVQSGWTLRSDGLYQYVLTDTKDVVAVYRSLGNIYTLVECDVDNDGVSAIVKSKDAFDGFVYVTANGGEVQTKGTVPLLTNIWTDHMLEDQTWLRADNFSWHSGDVYVAVYEKLLAELENSSVETDSFGVSYNRTANGYKIIVSDDDSTAGDAYINYGVAWYYILDTENRRFKLPRTKYSTTGVRTNVGDYVEAGAPNITGESYSTNGSGAVWGLCDQESIIDNSSGALYLGSDVLGGYSGGTNTHGRSLNFDASRSSSVYGASDTIQPPATQMYLYFYVGNFTPEATEVNAGINTETLNNKVDRSDLVDVAAVIESYRSGTSWYRIWSDGWCEQGGKVGLAGDGGTGTITLLKEMLDTDYDIQLTFESIGRGNSDFYGSQVKGVTTSTFSYWTRCHDTWYGGYLYWEVKGKVSNG